MNEDLAVAGGAAVHLLSGFISWGVFHVVVEGVLAGALVYVILLWTKQKEQNLLLTERQIEDWNPEPLVSEVPVDHPGLNPNYVEGKMGKYLSLDGKEYLNLATSNFLGLVGDERIEKVAKQTIFKYGVGSCGPRGFYGTVDVHLDLEKQIAEFLSCEEAVLYSYGFATIASAIPAYAKRGDVIFADKGVNFAIQKGLQASRSHIVWFEHNNVEDLERLLIQQSEFDKKNPKAASSIRRFVVVEGLYINSGDLCPLPALMDLKWKYKFRIFIDESISFGVIGSSGRGVTEHFGIDIIDIDMIMGSLENAVASTGGFCAGRTFVVGHQRLSGLGYCFSASLPPLLATAASESLRIMDSEPDRFKRLRTNTRSIHLGLMKAFENSNFEVIGFEFSPVQHIRCKNCTKEESERRLDLLVDKLRHKMIAVSRARYLENEEQFPPEPSIRVMIQSELTAGEIAKFLHAVHELCREIEIS